MFSPLKFGGLFSVFLMWRFTEHDDKSVPSRISLSTDCNAASLGWGWRKSLNMVLSLVGCLEEFDKRGAGYHGEYTEYFYSVNRFYR